MENSTTIQNKFSTKSVHVYKSDKPNCGIIPDEDKLIYQFGEIQEKYPTKYIKLLVNDKLEKHEIAKELRKLADILEGTKKIQYESWVKLQTN